MKLWIKSTAIGAVAVSASVIGERVAVAGDPAPHAEVMVIHATKCEKKSVDPQIGDAPPALGYDCLKLLEKKSMTLAVNQPSTTPLPNGRTFQLVHTGKADAKYKVTASISSPDGSGTYNRLADVAADPNKPFNVGGFNYQGGVLLLTIKIVP
ncbi:MAG: hypothetical protein KIT84_13295 [Labilithrix sp.]|nr:hypothetical protein [Labilithrix sp.]MCW5811992.1 hypothetical protein [Labilithrix sp.]